MTITTMYPLTKRFVNQPDIDLANRDFMTAVALIDCHFVGVDSSRVFMFVCVLHRGG